MSVQESTVHPSNRPFWRRRSFWKVTLPVISIAAAILAGVLVYNAYYGSNGVPPQVAPGGPKPTSTPPTVKLDSSVHSLILRFVQTAVARKNLAESYKLIGPGLREGITLKQWVAGNVTVVPYPVDAKTRLVYEKPDWSYRTQARIQVHVVTPDEPKLVETQDTNTFFVTLVKRHGRWLVDNWVPRWTPPIPTA